MLTDGQEWNLQGKDPNFTYILMESGLVAIDWEGDL